MQLSSMTGFARKKTNFNYQGKKYSWTWEFKSVNAKNMDIKVRLPQTFDDLDENVKGVCAKVFSRGTFNISLEMEVENTEPEITINEQFFSKIVDKMKEVYEQDESFFVKPSPADILKIDGVVQLVHKVPGEEELAVLKHELCQSMYATANALKRDRQQEGKKIGKVLLKILSQISDTVDMVEQICADTPQRMKEKVHRQIAELANGTAVPEERLAQEALLLVMRADVKEEIDRLKAHIKTASELLESTEPVGRRLDFLCQEFNREANTLCSKSSDIEQTKYGMELKALIEQLREQVQNME